MSSKSKFTPHLVVIEGQEKGKAIALKEGTNIIGRSKGDIIVTDPRLSRSHVAVEYDKSSGKVTFTDLKSLNGTFLNEKVSKGDELKDGDRLRVGETVFDCQISAPQEVPKKSKSSSKKALPEKKEAPVVHKKRAKSKKEPSSEPVAASKEKTHSGQIKSWYGQVPRRRRIQILALLLVGVTLWFAGGEKKDPASLAKRETSIREKVEKGSLNEALVEAESFAEANPDSGRAQALLGDLYLKQNEEAKALEYYQKALDNPPVDPVIHAHLMDIYLRFSMQAASDEDKSHWQKNAKSEYRKLAEGIQKVASQLTTAVKEQKIKPVDYINKNPGIRRLFVESAQLFLRYDELDEPSDQLIVIGRALQRDIAPDSPVGFKLEAQVALKQNQLQPAVTALEGALQRGENDLWVIENLALAKYRLKDFAGTENVVQKWIQIAPGSSKPYLVMSYLRISQKDTVGAIPFLQKIIQNGQKDPKDAHYPEALYLVGQVMVQADKKAQALQYVQESCRLGYQAGCQSPLLENRVPTSPANRSPQQVPAEKQAAPVKKK